MPVPYTFGTATAAIPLSQLDSNFSTAITIGNTAVQLGNTVTTLNNMTLANVTISSGNVTLTNVSVTTANVSGTANVSSLVVLTNETVLGNTTVTGNVTASTSVVTPFVSSAAATNLLLKSAGTTAVTIDTSQNVGVGVTPSAWYSSSKAIQIGTTSSIENSNGTLIGYNNYRNTSGAETYLTSSYSSLYYQNSSGQFVWYTAPSGTAGNAITFTQAMTLDASGNLGVGVTSPATKLDVSGVASTNGSTRFLAKFADTSAVALGNGGGILFRGVYTGTTLVDASGIQAYKVNATDNNYSYGLLFSTRANGGDLTGNMKLDESGNLTILGATATKASGTTWANPSDQRLKNNIRDYSKGATELMQVRVREWEYNGKGGTTEGMKGLGVIADEVMTVLPNTVDNYDAKLNADDKETTTIKRFDATEITWLLVKTVQEQQALIQSLTDRLTALEAK